MSGQTLEDRREPSFWDAYPDEATKEVVFNLLATDRVREVLLTLRDTDELPLRELATRVAAAEGQTEPEAVSETDRKRVYVTLYQTHLPSLEEYHVVDYDPETGTVSPGQEDVFELFQGYLDLARHLEAEPDVPSTGRLFDLLADSRRRAVIEYLAANGGEAWTKEIAMAVAAEEFDTSVDDLSEAQWKRIYGSLPVFELPTLVEAGLIRWESEDEQPQLCEGADAVRFLMNANPQSPLTKISVVLRILRTTLGF